jgi:hypothetical protein
MDARPLAGEICVVFDEEAGNVLKVVAKLLCRGIFPVRSF